MDKLKSLCLSLPDFICAFCSDWMAIMSGAASVPFTFWAIGADTPHASHFWAILAIFCFIFASFRVWFKEREKVIRLQAAMGNPKDKKRAKLIYTALEPHFTEGQSLESAYPHSTIVLREQLQIKYNQWIKDTSQTMQMLGMQPDEIFAFKNPFGAEIGLESISHHTAALHYYITKYMGIFSAIPDLSSSAPPSSPPP